MANSPDRPNRFAPTSPVTRSVEASRAAKAPLRQTPDVAADTDSLYPPAADNSSETPAPGVIKVNRFCRRIIRR